MKAKIAEIITAAAQNGYDPVGAVQEYFEAKDSRITRLECQLIVNRIRATMTDESEN